jgi:hypothetical protein
MIIKTWQFENSKQEIPSWLKNNCEKRINSPRLWVYTQYGEIPANEGHWISLNLRGHVDVHKTKPMKTNIIQEMGASFLFVAMAILVIVSSAGNVMKDFNVKITVRNNRLLQAILKKYKSVADLARKMNRSQSRVNALVTMLPKKDGPNSRSKPQWLERTLARTPAKHQAVNVHVRIYHRHRRRETNNVG